MYRPQPFIKGWGLFAVDKHPNLWYSELMKGTLGVALSDNRKTGPMANIYRTVGTTCPSSCPLLERGCYAKKWPVTFQSKRALESTLDFGAFLDNVRRENPSKIVRLNVSGDVFKDDRVDVEFLNELIAGAKNNPDITIYGYTRGFEKVHEAGFTPDKFPANLTLLASVDSAEDAAKAKALGWKYARVERDYDKEAGKDEVLCPIDAAKAKGKEPKTTCARCKLCFDKRYEGINIVFQYVKGGRKRKGGL